MNFKTYETILDACKTAFTDIDSNLDALNNELLAVNKELEEAKTSKFSRNRTASIARLTNERDEVAKEIHNYEAKRNTLLNSDANPAANLVQTRNIVSKEIKSNAEAVRLVDKINEHLTAIQTAIDSLKVYEQKQRDNWHADLQELDSYRSEKQYDIVTDMPLGNRLLLPIVQDSIRKFRIANNA